MYLRHEHDRRSNLDDAGARRLVCAVLLAAIQDAKHGDTAARSWIAGDAARDMVGLLNSEMDECWPPTAEQLAGANTARTGLYDKGR